MNDRCRYICAVYLILLRGHDVLLLKRANTGYEDGNYSLVAGHMDGGETIKQAIIREAKEECGIEIDEKDVEIVTFLHRKTTPERMDFFLKCESWKGKAQNLEPDKCSELSWHDVDKLPKNMVDYVRRAIKNYQAGIKWDDFGWENGK